MRAAADNLVRLARLTGDHELLQGADHIFATFAAEAKRLPSAHSQMITALQRGIGPSLEVVIVGEPDREDTRSLLAVVHSTYLPQAAVLLIPPGEHGEPVRRLTPFTRAYETVDGRAAAYVCRDFQCKLPTTDPAKLAELLEEVVPKAAKSR